MGLAHSSGLGLWQSFNVAAASKPRKADSGSSPEGGTPTAAVCEMLRENAAFSQAAVVVCDVLLRAVVGMDRSVSDRRASRCLCGQSKAFRANADDVRRGLQHAMFDQGPFRRSSWAHKAISQTVDQSLAANGTGASLAA